MSRNGDPVSDSGSQQFVTKRPKFSSDNNDLQTQKTDLGKAWWVRVNDCTWKLTDGEMSRTPASHGQWGGYNTERAVAWVIDVGWVARSPSWYARCGDKSYGPTNLADAKTAAHAFVTDAPLEKDELAFVGAVDLNAAAVRALEPPTLNDEGWIDPLTWYRSKTKTENGGSPPRSAAVLKQKDQLPT